MENRILVSYNRDKVHLGYEVFMNEERIALIDGNNASINPEIPRILFNLSPQVIWGMSHPDVINPILQGNIKPYRLITNRSMAHALFEHGMKAAWGQVTILKEVPVLTKLDTFYTLIASEKDKLELNQNISSMTYYSSQQLGDNALEFSFNLGRRVIISNSRKTRVTDDSLNKVIFLDEIDTYASVII